MVYDWDWDGDVMNENKPFLLNLFLSPLQILFV
jgi:hypothetical protein